MGLMDGTVRVMKNVHQDSREDVWQGPVHAKYVVRAKCGPEDYFATGSYDRTVHLHRMSAEGEYSHVQKWSFGGNVESIEFTPDQIALIVSARGDNYLSYIQLRDFTVGSFLFILLFFFLFLITSSLDLSYQYECHGR